MVCTKKYLLYLVFFAMSFNACNEGVEIPVPENRQTVYKITPSGQDIEYMGIRLEVPAGALSSEQEITFLKQNICDTSYGSVYFFLCEAVSLSPASLEFAVPVRLSISLDMQWIRVIDEEGYAVNMDKEKITMYELDTVYHTCTALEDCELSYSKDQLTVTSEINGFGVYQLGIDESYIDYRKGFFKVRYENFTGTDSFQFNSNIIGRGSASFIPAFLMNTFTLEIILSDKDGQGIGWIESQISGVGMYEKVMSTDQQELFVAYYMPYEDYGYAIRSIDGDTAKINITRFDEEGGRVEGILESSAYKIYNNPDLPIDISTVKIHFSVPKY